MPAAGCLLWARQPSFIICLCCWLFSCGNCPSLPAVHRLVAPGSRLFVSAVPQFLTACVLVPRKTCVRCRGWWSTCCCSQQPHPQHKYCNIICTIWRRCVCARARVCGVVCVCVVRMCVCVGAWWWWWWLRVRAGDAAMRAVAGVEHRRRLPVHRVVRDTTRRAVLAGDGPVQRGRHGGELESVVRALQYPRKLTHAQAHRRTRARTRARRHAGTQARRHAGTQARRHASVYARSHARTHARPRLDRVLVCVRLPLALVP